MNEKISILMSVYSPNWFFFSEAMQSIQNQTYKNFELILVSDGEDKREIEKQLLSYSFAYHIIENESNLGLTRSLNKGISSCTGKYIARFDDDDIMESTRLEKQVDFLKYHPECIAVVSDYIVINADGNILSSKKISNEKIESFLLCKGNCLCHSSLMIRKKDLCEVGKYDANMLYAQDYDLYLRLLKYGKICKIDESLLKFRIKSNRTSLEKSLMSMCCAYYASLKYLSNHGGFLLFLCRTFHFFTGVIRICFFKQT